MTEVIHIRFRVEIRDSKHSYQATQEGEAEVEVTCPQDVAVALDTGNILHGLFKAALVDFETVESEDEEED